MRKAETRTGLRTTVNAIRRLYETGRKATDHMKHNLKIVFDPLLPKWNCRALPFLRHELIDRSLGDPPWVQRNAFFNTNEPQLKVIIFQKYYLPVPFFLWQR